MLRWLWGWKLIYTRGQIFGFKFPYKLVLQSYLQLLRTLETRYIYEFCLHHMLTLIGLSSCPIFIPFYTRDLIFVSIFTYILSWVIVNIFTIFRSSHTSISCIVSTGSCVCKRERCCYITSANLCLYIFLYFIEVTTDRRFATTAG